MNPDWISKERYLSQTGFSEGRLRGWIERNLTEGVHYTAFGKTTAICVPEMDQWLKTGGPKALGPWVTASKSESPTTVKPTPKPFRAAPTTKLTLPSPSKSESE